MSEIFQKDTAQEWKERIIRELKGAPFEKVMSQTDDGIEIQPFYVDESRDSILSTGPEMPWSIHQEFIGTQPKKNTLILEALAAGVDSISVRAERLAEDLKGVIVDIIRVEVGGEDFQTLWPAYLMDKGIDFKKVKGGYAFDPYGTMLQKGDFSAASIIPPIIEAFTQSSSQMPQWKSLRVEGDRYHNSGATAVQELAFTLSQINAYARVDDQLLGDMSICLAAETDYFETACKLRAFRILWANLVKAYGKNDEVEISARSSKRDLAPIDQHGNLLRATSQCMAAVVGGADRVSLRPFDKKGDAFSYRMARNIQKLLTHESYFDKNTNPMKGAYLFEELTGQMAEKAWELFKEIEEKGGWLKNCESGSIQSQVKESAEQWAMKVSEGESTWLGVNLYPDEGQDEWKGVEVISDGKSLPILKSKMA